MAIGANDYIDQLLVKKYSQEKVDNHENIVSMVNPEKMMDAMRDYASMQRNMFALNNKLKQSCNAINSLSARYKKGVNFA